VTPKMVYLVGPPASGKSTVMAAMLDILSLATGDWHRIWPTNHDEFRGEDLENIFTGKIQGLSLGVTRDGGFSGTDAIGMASSSEAQAWAEEAPEWEWPELILGEGSRLTIGKFFVACAARCDLTVGLLTASQERLDMRCMARGSTQKESFRRGAATRAANAAEAARLVGAPVVEVDTSKMSAFHAATLILGRAGL